MAYESVGRLVAELRSHQTMALKKPSQVKNKRMLGENRIELKLSPLKLVARFSRRSKSWIFRLFE